MYPLEREVDIMELRCFLKGCLEEGLHSKEIPTNNNRNDYVEVLRLNMRTGEITFYSEPPKYNDV